MSYLGRYKYRKFHSTLLLLYFHAIFRHIMTDTQVLPITLFIGWSENPSALKLNINRYLLKTHHIITRTLRISYTDFAINVVFIRAYDDAKLHLLWKYMGNQIKMSRILFLEQYLGQTMVMYIVLNKTRYPGFVKIS